jgi:hypothetical protein
LFWFPYLTQALSSENIPISRNGYSTNTMPGAGCPAGSPLGGACASSAVGAEVLLAGCETVGGAVLASVCVAGSTEQAESVSASAAESASVISLFPVVFILSPQNYWLNLAVMFRTKNSASSLV